MSREVAPHEARGVARSALATREAGLAPRVQVEHRLEEAVAVHPLEEVEEMPRGAPLAGSMRISTLKSPCRNPIPSTSRIASASTASSSAAVRDDGYWKRWN